MSALQLTSGDVKLDQLLQVYRFGATVTLNPSCRPAVENAAAQIAAAAAGDVPVYGVNTGFGKLASIKIAPEDTGKLQRNLILSPAAVWASRFPPTWPG